MVLPYTTQTVLGDKDDKAKTKMFNEYNDGHVVDCAEVGAGDEGEDVCNEIKVFNALKKNRSAGRGSDDGGGRPASVGHIYAMGNTEEQARVDNLGCRERGRRCDGPFNHYSGKGWVKAKKGAYYDAQFRKKNKVNVLLHEHLGGGFSPPAAYKIRKSARAARHGTDRTRYPAARKRVAFTTFHTQRIGVGIVQAETFEIQERVNVKKRRACDVAKHLASL